MDLRSDRFPAPPRLPTCARHVLVPPPPPVRVRTGRDSTLLPPPLPPPAARPLGLAGSRALAVGICGALALVAAMAVGVSSGSRVRSANEGARVASTVRVAVAAR